MDPLYPLTKVRNIGIMAHIDAGKTTVSERLLFFSGKTYKLGEVHEGTATLDWMPQEQERGITITSAATTFSWADCQISLIDTPGHVDFTAEVERSLRVLDGAIALFCAVGGVQPQSEQVWRQSEKYNVPKLAFINKMDRPGADFFGVVTEIEKELGANALPVVIPMGAEDRFEGIVDLIEEKAMVFSEDPKAKAPEIRPIPPEMIAQVRQWRHHLVEKCAELDDTLLENYLSGQTPSPDELRTTLRAATIARRVVPVFCGAAFKNKGIHPLLDGIVRYLPSPVDVPPVRGTWNGEEVERPADPEAPFSALVFKIVSDRHVGRLTYLRLYSGTLRPGTTVLNSTQEVTQRVGRILRMHANRQEAIEMARAGDIVAVIGVQKARTGDTLCDEHQPVVLESIEFPAPVISISIAPDNRQDEEKLNAALHALAEEDPTFVVTHDEETGETIISGMGELHLEIIVDRLRREWQVESRVAPPEVAYRETATAPVVEGQYRHVKQTGGRGQYAHVVFRLEPLPPGSGFEFVNEVVGGRIPAQYIPAVEKGVIKAMEKGPFAGYPVVDLRVTVFDGSYHEVDSSDFAFQEAARQCFRQLFLQARPVLLEPIMSVEVVTPEEYVGAISGSICQRRGRIEAMDRQGANRIIEGLVPLSEMFGYANTVRTLTQGRASFTMTFEHYEAVPFALAETIIQKRRAANKIR